MTAYSSHRQLKNKTRRPVSILPAFLFLVLPLLTCCIREGKSPSVWKEETYSSAAQSKNFPDVRTAGEMLPSIAKNDEIIKHFAYTLSYNEKHEQASWVAYRLTGAMVAGTEKRENDFRPDPDVPTGSAEPEDYRKSGYDRGHLAPSADMKWSKTAMQECFYLSNISPQLHAFNAGIWEDLEEAVRNWAVRDSEIYIVTGPVLKDGLPKIGKDGVSVPEYFYKVILDDKGPDRKAIGFIIPNQKATLDIWHFAVPVDSVEALTGIDFFPQLDDSLEVRLEKACDRNAWIRDTKYERYWTH